eukprot:341292-Amphidinium_carterae.2
MPPPSMPVSQPAKGWSVLQIRVQFTKSSSCMPCSQGWALHRKDGLAHNTPDHALRHPGRKHLLTLPGIRLP